MLYYCIIIMFKLVLIKMNRGSTAGNLSVLLRSAEYQRKIAVWTRRDWSAPQPCLVPLPSSPSAS